MPPQSRTPHRRRLQMAPQVCLHGVQPPAWSTALQRLHSALRPFAGSVHCDDACNICPGSPTVTTSSPLAALLQQPMRQTSPAKAKAPIPLSAAYSLTPYPVLPCTPAGMAAQGADPAMGHQQQNGGIDDATGRASHGGGKHQGEVELARKVDLEVGLHRTPLPAAWQWVAAWHWDVVLQRGTAGAGPYSCTPWGFSTSYVPTSPASLVAHSFAVPLRGMAPSVFAKAMKLSAASWQASQCACPQDLGMLRMLQEFLWSALQCSSELATKRTVPCTTCSGVNTSGVPVMMEQPSEPLPQLTQP